MTITLCIETSSVYCSLALAVEDQTYLRHEKLQRRHNEKVLPLVDSLYREAGVQPRATELIGFGAGPGSFTGVRIAASLAQGIAMASGCAVVPMAGSEILLRSGLLAMPARGIGDPAPTTRWLTVVPSRADAFYLALYEQADDAAASVAVVQQDRLYTQPPQWLEEQTLPLSPSLSLAGPRPQWLPEAMTFEREVDPAANAAVMVAPVRQLHNLGCSKPAQEALPIYVEGDSPWQKVAAASAPS